MKLDSTAMNFGDNALTVRKAAVDDPFAQKSKTISDTYAEHAKLVFLFDVSVSMNAKVTRDRNGSSFSDQFIWPDELMRKIHADATRAVNKMNAMDENLDNEEALAFELHDEYLGPNGEYMFMPTDDEDLRARIMRKDLTKQFGILPALGAHQEPLSRMDIVKKLAKNEIIARFRKYPNSRVAVVAFGGNTLTLFDDGTADDVEAQLDKLNIHGMEIKNENGEITDYVDHGDTKILSAIRKGMDICRHAPSQVGLHHFILVTDGGDHEAGRSMPEWVATFKQSGIVLDYIHIGGDCANDGIRAACVATGGEFATCNTERDIAEKFTLAATRLCLPPAPGK